MATTRAPRATKPPTRGRPVATRKRIAAVADTGFEALQFTTDQDEPEPDMVPLFYIDGTPYLVPRVFPVGLALKWLRTARRAGDGVAASELLEDIIGADAYQALIAYRGLTSTGLTDLMALVMRLALGSLERPKAGGSRSA